MQDVITADAAGAALACELLLSGLLFFVPLEDVNARARINVQLKRISLTGNLGDSKPVGDGVYELRVDYDPDYRVYYSQRGKKILLLLIGGDKSSQ